LSGKAVWSAEEWIQNSLKDDGENNEVDDDNDLMPAL
jgi:hypothetical protein